MVETGSLIKMLPSRVMRCTQLDCVGLAAQSDLSEDDCIHLCTLDEACRNNQNGTWILGHVKKLSSAFYSGPGYPSPSLSF